MKHRWEGEGRTETGHPAPSHAADPAPARQAVVQARKLEDKALKCITIAQRMLPGADNSAVEDQATDLMFLPERSIMATLQRQADLAGVIAKKDEKCAPEGEEEEVAEKVEAKKEEVPPMAEEKEVEVKKEKKEEVPPVAEEKEIEAKKNQNAPNPKVEAPKVEELKSAEAKKEEAPKKEEEIPKEAEPKEVEVSKDLLDILFDNAEIVPEAPKMGAKKLSGIVKQASSVDPLGNLWDAPPDVSATFK